MFDRIRPCLFLLACALEVREMALARGVAMASSGRFAGVCWTPDSDIS